MNLAAMDNIAVNHFCWLQHCSALAKILLVIVVLGFLLTTRALAFVGGLGLLLLAIAVGNKLPLKVLMPLVLIPMIFASLFARDLAPNKTHAVLNVSYTNFQDVPQAQKKLVFVGQKNPNRKITVKTDEYGEASFLIPSKREKAGVNFSLF